MTAHEQYQMLVGEAGIPRKDYLYEMPYWEILLTIRGFRRRNILQYQLQRIQAFCSAFAMGGNKNNIEPQEFLPLPFDDDSTDDALTDEEIAEIRAAIQAENERRSKGKSGSG